MQSDLASILEYNWNYKMLEGATRVMAWAAVIAHLLFYFTLHHATASMQDFVLRMVVVGLHVPLLFYPASGWKVWHKGYFELAMALVLPGYFTYLLLSDISLYWAITLVFVIIFYGTLTKWQVAVFLYPGAVVGAYLAVSMQKSLPLETVWEMFRIELICLLALILVQVLKMFFEFSHNAMVELKEKADKQNVIFSALLDISVEVSRFDDLDEIFHLLLKRFETIFPDRGFGLMVEGPRPKIIPHMAFRGISQDDSSFLLQVHPYVLGFASEGTGNDEEQLSSLEGDDWQGFGGGISSTSIKGQTHYCFKLFIKGRRLDGDERQTLEIFLESIRGMTRTRIQAQELERYSNTDHLTGLYNRNYFDRVIKKWREKAVVENPFSVVFGDINGLKRINDTYGHHAGDELIKACADLIVATTRQSDMVFRLGGDEILILCPATDADQVDNLYSRLKENFETLTVPCMDEVSGEITMESAYMSFGVASSIEQGPEEVVALADKRMFANKKRWYAIGEGERYR